MERTLHMQLYRAFHAQRSYLRPHLTELGLGPGQPKFLGYLLRNGPCTQKDLAAYFEVDPAAVSRMLDALERGGFLTRQAREKDRRAGQVQLTAKGEAAYLAWQEGCRQMEQVMLQGFTQQEREQFSDYLARAYQNIRAQRERG